MASHKPMKWLPPDCADSLILNFQHLEQQGNKFSYLNHPSYSIFLLNPKQLNMIPTLKADPLPPKCLSPGERMHKCGVALQESLLGNASEQCTHSHCNRSELRVTEWTECMKCLKKPTEKGKTLHDFILWDSHERQAYKDKMEISICLRQGEGTGLTIEGCKGFYWGGGSVPNLVYGSGCTIW